MYNFVNNYSEPLELLEDQTEAALALPDGKYRLTITDSPVNSTQWEIMDAEVNGGTAYLERGIEGTIAQEWTGDSVIYSTITAGILEMMISRLMPAGGGGGQSLVKASAEDFDTKWDDRALPIAHITVGNEGDDYGYESFPNQFGELTDNAFSAVDKVLGVRWNNTGSYYGATLNLMTASEDYPENVRVTIGDVSLDFTSPYYGGYGLSITPEQYEALPKSGTHPIKFEAI